VDRAISNLNVAGEALREMVPIKLCFFGDDVVIPGQKMIGYRPQSWDIFGQIPNSRRKGSAYGTREA